MIFDIINITIAISGILIGMLVTIVIAIISIKHSTKIAKDSGAFKNPQLFINFFDINLGNPNKAPDTWCFVLPGNRKDRTLMPFPFYIGNIGDKSCEDTVLLIQGPKISIPETTKGLESKITPAVFKDSIKRSVECIGGFNQVSYLLPPINPKSAFEISEMFWLDNTLIPITTDVTTKDNKNVRVKARVSLMYPYTITVLFKDNPSLSYSLSIECITAESIREAIDYYSSPLRKEWNEFVKKLPFIDKFKFFIGRKRVNYKRIRFILFEKDKTIKVKNQNYHFMKVVQNTKVKMGEIVIPRPVK